ncbi:MAG: MerR family transcriptional regulator [Candidatus Dormibacteraceae bacterium]
MATRMIAEDDGLRIEAVARRTALTKRTIRYYEELGLIEAVSRSGSGQRLYSAGDIMRIERVRDLKRAVGLSLAEIQELLDAEAVRDRLRERYRATEDAGERSAMIAEAIEVVSRQLGLITRKREALAGLQIEYEDRLARLREAERQLTDGGAGARPVSANP